MHKYKRSNKLEFVGQKSKGRQEGTIKVMLTVKKKKPVLFIITMAVVASIAVFLGMENSTSIPERPSDTALEFWIAENVEGINWDGHDVPYEMFGGKAYLGRNYPLEWIGAYTELPGLYVIYTITAWPDYADSGEYVTGIEITDPAVTVYGLTVNSSFEEFDALFQDRGFDIKVIKNEYWEQHQAEKDGFCFSLRTGIFTEKSSKKSVLTISAEVSNLDNIVF